jgi:hypothetical protein
VDRPDHRNGAVATIANAAAQVWRELTHRLTYRPGTTRVEAAVTFLRHVAAFLSPFGILRARIVFSYIRRRLDQDRLTEKFLIC